MGSIDFKTTFKGITNCPEVSYIFLFYKGVNMINVSKLKREYEVNNKSILNIARENGLGYKKVRNIFLKNGVILRNKNTAGLHKHTEETKRIMSAGKIGSKNPNYGKCSKETKQLLAKYRKEIWDNPIMVSNI